MKIGKYAYKEGEQVPWNPNLSVIAEDLMGDGRSVILTDERNGAFIHLDPVFSVMYIKISWLEGQKSHSVSGVYPSLDDTDASRILDEFFRIKEANECGVEE